MKCRIVLAIGFLAAMATFVPMEAFAGGYYRYESSKTTHTYRTYRSESWRSGKCSSSIIYECRPVARIRRVPGHWEKEVVVKRWYVPGYKEVTPLERGYGWREYRNCYPPQPPFWDN